MSFFPRQLYYKNIAAAEASGDHSAGGAGARHAEAAFGPDEHVRRHGRRAGRSSPRSYNGKNKLFFFFGFDGLNRGQEDAARRWATINHTFPTMANRQGDFSQLLNVDAARYQIYDPLSVRVDPARAGHSFATPFRATSCRTRIINPAYNTYMKFLPTPNNEPLDPKRWSR